MGFRVETVEAVEFRAWGFEDLEFGFGHVKLQLSTRR